MPDAFVDLALRTASTPAAGLDLGRHLQALCDDLARALELAAAVVVVLDPPAVHGSDAAAELIGAAQQHANVGPAANAVRSGRPLLVPDLVRVGPPALAAAAHDCGLVSVGVVPLQADGRTVGVLELLGTVERPVGGAHLDRLGPLPAVLAARMVDVAALTPVPGPARPAVDDGPATTRLAHVPPPRPVLPSGPATTRLALVPPPSPRSRHRLSP